MPFSRRKQFGYWIWVVLATAWFLSVFPITWNLSATAVMLTSVLTLGMVAWLWNATPWGRRLVTIGATITFFGALALNLVGAAIPEWTRAVAKSKPALDRSAAIGWEKKAEELGKILRGEALPTPTPTAPAVVQTPANYVPASNRSLELESVQQLDAPCEGTFEPVQLKSTSLALQVRMPASCTTVWLYGPDPARGIRRISKPQKHLRFEVQYADGSTDTYADGPGVSPFTYRNAAVAVRFTNPWDEPVTVMINP